MKQKIAYLRQLAEKARRTEQWGAEALFRMKVDQLEAEDKQKRRGSSNPSASCEKERMENDMKNIDQTKMPDKTEERELDAIEGLRQIIREQNFEIVRLKFARRDEGDWS